MQSVFGKAREPRDAACSHLHFIILLCLLDHSGWTLVSLLGPPLITGSAYGYPQSPVWWIMLIRRKFYYIRVQRSNRCRKCILSVALFDQIKLHLLATDSWKYFGRRKGLASPMLRDADANGKMTQFCCSMTCVSLKALAVQPAQWHCMGGEHIVRNLHQWHLKKRKKPNTKDSTVFHVKCWRNTHML